MAKVRANQRGYYGGMIREAGDVFHADGKASWFDPVSGETDHVAVAERSAAADHEPKRGRGRPKAETVQAPVAEPFADPVRVENEVNDLTGQTEPDWVRPI